MIDAFVTIGIGPWDIELGMLAWVVVPLLVVVVVYSVLKD